jgi:6-phosphogluconolactonase
MDDGKLATHAKARALFLDGWQGCSTLIMGGTGDAAAEARDYEAQLRSLPSEVLPVNAAGLPVFDIALIGVGDDGHVGSLYPGREEVMDATGRCVQGGEEAYCKSHQTRL